MGRGTARLRQALGRVVVAQRQLVGLGTDPVVAARVGALDLAARDVHIVIELHAGTAAATVWTNDLTHAYVHENSAYSS